MNMNVPAWFSRSIYRAQEAAMHRPTFAMLAELERTQWLSREGIEACQTQRLNYELASALAHSPGMQQGCSRPAWLKPSRPAR